MSVAGFSQHIVWIEDTLHYCFTEPQTRFVVKTIRHDSIHKAQIINLQQRIQADSIKISAFEARKSVTDTISKKKDDVIEVKEERLQLSKKQLRKEKRPWIVTGD
jgi:hypothetical protein